MPRLTTTTATVHRSFSSSSSSILQQQQQHHMGLSIPDSTAIPTAYEATIGNVWQTTTWKRDTLLELKGELLTVASSSSVASSSVTTLDDLATERQRWDLYLIDGLHRIVQQVEDNDETGTDTTTTTNENPCHSFLQRLEQKIAAEMGDASSAVDHHHPSSSSLSESEWNRLLTWCQQEMETILSLPQPTRTIYPPIRDFLRRQEEIQLWQNEHFVTFLQEQQQHQHDRPLPSPTIPTTTTTGTVMDHHHGGTSVEKGTMEDTATASTDRAILSPPVPAPYLDDSLLHHSVIRYRLIWTSALLQVLQPSWHVITTRSDQDMDRDAATGTTTTTEMGRSISLPAFVTVLRAYLGVSRPAVPSSNETTTTTTTTTDHNHHPNKNNIDNHLTSSDPRMDALWDLMDHDRDGRMDQSEMDRTCQFHVLATQAAIRRFVTEVLEVVPLDHCAPPMNKEELNTSPTFKSKNMGWRQRRRMRQDQTAFRKRLNHVLQHHFDNELEMPHRLRCIYSWANKQHQNNKINSILVEEDTNKYSGIMTSVVGRKRYVELYPKIARSEFREVQRIHFPQLDGVGQEYMKSLREEFWILQGKGRQNRELQRDCTLFLVGVCILDYIVLSM